MNDEIRKKILGLLDQHRLMTITTLRPDGSPQATTVGYAKDGLILYFLCGRDAQKARNLARDDRIPLTIDHDTSDPIAISSLSMAARAQPVDDPTEVEKVFRLLPLKYPEYMGLAMPKLEEIRIFRVRPTIISVLDYSLGFGHTDLVNC